MAENIKKYLSLEGLTSYDAKIKSWVEDRDDMFDAAGAAATVQGKLDEEIARAKAAEEANATAAGAAQSAAEAAQAAADQAQGEVDALETYVGTIPSTAGVTNVVAYIEKKTEGIATDAALGQLQSDVDAAEAAIKAIQDDYLVEADKTELSGLIADNAGVIAKLDGAVTVEGSVKKQIKDAVDAEKSARETAVSGVQAEVDALEQTHATDKAALETAIGEAKAAGEGAQAHSEGVAADLAEYEAANDAAVKAIADDYLKAADKTELNNAISAEAARADAAEKANAAAITAIKDGAEMDSFADVEAAIEALEGGESGLASRVEAIEDDYLKAADKTELSGAIAAEQARAEGVESGLDARLVEVETFFKTAEDETLDTALDTLVEIQKYVTTEGAAADEMVKDIAANTKAIEDEVARATGVEGGLETRLAAVEAKFGEGEGTVEDMIADVQGEVDALEQTHATDKQALEAADEAIKGRLDALEAIDHEHSNKELLDSYTQTEADLADAVAKKHEHANAAVLNGITAEKVSAWDAAEQNAKDYADSLNTAMDTRMDAAEGAITTLQEEVAGFTAITTEEVNALFA